MRLTVGADEVAKMSVNPRTLALSYISYLVSNLNKKNYKSSVAELADVSRTRRFSLFDLFTPIWTSVDVAGGEIRL